MKKKSDSLDFFIDQLMEEKSFIELEQEVQDQIRKDLKEKAQDAVNVAIIRHIPSENIDEFRKRIKTEGAEELKVFCQQNIPNVEVVVAQALMDFRQSYLGM